MKKVICMSILLLGVTSALEAKLQIRRNYFGDRVARMPYNDRTLDCCADERGWHQPTSIAGAEGEVNRLRMEVINDYDSGIYMADWSKKRRRALDIQTKLGYTVPERYTWGR